MIVDQHGPQFGQSFRRVFERGKDDRPLVDRERQQRHAVPDGNVQPVGQVVGSGSANQPGEVFEGMVGMGRPASIIAATYPASRQAPIWS